jgi:hypothetical protein
MSAKECKEDYKDNSTYESEGKYAEGKDDYDEKDTYEAGEKLDQPIVQINAIKINPSEGLLTEALRLEINFELDRDVVAGYWEVKFLVDSSHKRVIKILGQTDVEDYVDGESDMVFSVPSIDVSEIPPSTLANSGLLMAVFMVNGEEVASVNMVRFLLIFLY